MQCHEIGMIFVFKARTKICIMVNNIKGLAVFTLGLFLFLSIPAIGQNTVNDVKDKAIEALKTGNTEAFTALFNNPIDISLPYNDDDYSKAQAKVIVQKFLLQYKVKSFELKQSGSSSGGSVFVIGIYTATNGKTFRVYLLIKKQAQSAYIHLLEFEEE